MVALDLRQGNRQLQNLNRLSKWLLGEYDPSDFEESENPANTAEERTMARERFLKEVIKDDDGAYAQATTREHPLAIVLADVTTHQRLLDTTAPFLESLADDNGEQDRQRFPTPHQDGETQVGSDEHRPQDQPSLRTLGVGDSQFTVPHDLGKLLTELIVRVTNLEQSVAGSNKAASSTRIADNRASQMPNVHFGETFTADGDRRWSNDTLSPQPPRVNPRVNQPAVDRRWVGGAHAQRDSSWLNAGNQSTCDSRWRSMGHTRDVGQIVRKWQVRFSGQKGESIDTFLARVEDCRALANLTEEEVLSSLSELFTQKAATWYQNEKHKWHTWPQFEAAVRRWYGKGKGYQQRLLVEATNRTQGDGEPVRDYITCLVAIMRKMSPPLALSQQLDYLHRNLKPPLQAMIRRAEFRTVEELLDLALESEQTLENSRLFRPPPLPASALLPEMAYNPDDSQSRKPRLPKDSKVSGAVVETTKTPPETLEETLQRLVKKAVAESNRDQGSNNSRSPTGGPRRSRARRSIRKSPPKSSDGSDRRGGQKPDAGGSKEPNNRPKSPLADGKPTLKCFTCGLPGYTVRTCPKCSGNDSKGE